VATHTEQQRAAKLADVRMGKTQLQWRFKDEKLHVAAGQQIEAAGLPPAGAARQDQG